MVIRDAKVFRVLRVILVLLLEFHTHLIIVGLHQAAVLMARCNIISQAYIIHRTFIFPNLILVVEICNHLLVIGIIMEMLIEKVSY